MLIHAGSKENLNKFRIEITNNAEHNWEEMLGNDRLKVIEGSINPCIQKVVESVWHAFALSEIINSGLIVPFGSLFVVQLNPEELIVVIGIL